MKKLLIIAIVLMLSTPASALTIIPNDTRINETDITVFFTVFDGEELYEFHGDFKKGGNLNDQLQARKEELYLLILKKMYRGAKPKENTLESMQKWIEAGAMNKTVIIERREWKSTHPEPSLEDRIEALEIKVDALELVEIGTIDVY